jgi:GcrA cell cycle regulator
MNDDNSLSSAFQKGAECNVDPETTAEPDCVSPARPNPVHEKPVRRIVARKVTTATLTHRTCRWPIGDPTDPDFHYCGKSPQSGSPYCESHDRQSYQAVSRRK